MERQEWLESAKQRFGFATWPRRAGEAVQSRTSGFTLDVTPLADMWCFERRMPYGDGGYADYFQSVDMPQHRIMARVIEYPSYDTALLAMLEEVSLSMAATLPRLDTLGIKIGDIGFTGYETTPTRIVFVRHNVFLDVRSIGEEPVSVIDFAKFADQQVQEAVAASHS